jgi:hypothetical protein
MAVQLEQMPGAGGRTPRDSYPWDQWLNGNRWHLTRGEDYQVATLALRAYVYRKARAIGITVSTVRDLDGNGISIEAHRRDRDPATAPAAGVPHEVR